MTKALILDVRELMHFPSERLRFYGPKIECYVRDLLKPLDKSPVAYNVPKAVAIPAPCFYRCSDKDLKQVFSRLTQGMATDTVLMVRGSSLKERSGQSPTLFLRYDPLQAAWSLDEFCRSVREGQGEDPEMAVLATLMVGGISSFEDGSRGIGWNNVSFTGDSHYLGNPDEIHLSVVHGLGTRAVESGDEVISITADRKTGAITSFVVMEREGILEEMASYYGCRSSHQYRQKEAQYFDLKINRLALKTGESRVLCPSVAE